MNIHKLTSVDEVLKYGQLGELVITSKSGFDKLESLLESYYDEQESTSEAYNRGSMEAACLYSEEG